MKVIKYLSVVLLSIAAIMFMPLKASAATSNIDNSAGKQQFTQYAQYYFPGFYHRGYYRGGGYWRHRYHRPHYRCFWRYGWVRGYYGYGHRTAFRVCGWFY